MKYLFGDERAGLQYRKQVDNTCAAIMPAFGIGKTVAFKVVRGVRTLGDDQYSFNSWGFDAGKLVGGSTHLFE